MYSPETALRKIIFLRWIILAVLILLSATSKDLFGIIVPLEYILPILTVLLCVNAFSTWRLLYKYALYRYEIPIQLAIDIIGLSFLLYFTGGATNPFVSMFLPYLSLAATLLNGVELAVLSLLALCSYTILLGEYEPLELLNPDDSVGYHLAGMWLNFLMSVGILAGVLFRIGRASRRHETEAMRLREVALNNERVLALGSQAASIAHALSTPLATACLRSEELEWALEHQDLQAAHEDWSVLNAQLLRMRSALAEFKQLAETRPEAKMVLHPWLREFVDTWNMTHPDSLAVLQQDEAAKGCVFDAVGVGHVLSIFLDNARKILIQHGCLDRPIRVIARCDLNALYLSVVDNGPGIPQNLLLELGHRPVKSLHGHGIGLLLAQRQAHAMAGTLHIANQDNAGAILTLQLPRVISHSISQS